MEKYFALEAIILSKTRSEPLDVPIEHERHLTVS